MSAYLKSDFEDAEGYAKNLAAALTTFPPSIVRALADPTSGIVRTAKWPPRVSEAVEWCEAEFARRNRMAEVRRPAVVEAISPNEARRRRAVVEALKAELGPNWGLTAVEGQESRRRNSVYSGAAADYLRRNFSDGIGPKKG